MATDYTCDFTAFFRDLVPVEGAYGPRPVIPPFLERWLALAFPLPAGDPAARTTLDARSKKQGKSATAAAVALYMATRAKYAEVVIAAADMDQAKDRVLRAAKYAVETGPLSGHAKVYRDVIEFDNASTITALPQDWRGAAGGNYACVVFDELHTYTLEGQRRMFDELVIPPTQAHGVRWIASYAGWLNESALLKEWWDKALAGERADALLPIYRNAGAGLLALVDTGRESWRMPWTQGEGGARYMAEAEATERPNTFRRLYLNEWTSNESEFVSREAWQACYSPDVRPYFDGDRRRLVLGVDLSTSSDTSAVVGAWHNGATGQVEAVYCRVWRPNVLQHAAGLIRGGKPTIDLKSLSDEVLRLHAAGVVDCAMIDPFQGHLLIVEWQRAGVIVREFPQTALRTQSDQGLYDAIKARTIAHAGQAELAEAVSNAAMSESPRGLRIVKAGRGKIDPLIALSMAHYAAGEFQRAIGEVRTSPNFFYSDLPAGYTFAQVAGGQWTTLRTENVGRVHALDAASVASCPAHRRGESCPSCIEYYALPGGEFDRQELEYRAALAKHAGVPLSEAEARAELLDQQGRGPAGQEGEESAAFRRLMAKIEGDRHGHYRF